MKTRYWLSTIILFCAGALIYRFVYAYSFLGVVLGMIAVCVLLFGIISRLRVNFPRGMKWARLILWLLIVLVVIGAVITGGLLLKTAKGAENPATEYVIVLGAGVNGTKPSTSLRERLTAAKAYLEQYPNAVAVLSGGQGENEDITEAQCMYDWLIAAGIAQERLYKEEKSTSTKENLQFSLALLEETFGEKPTRVAVVSNEFHLLRADILAEREGITVLGVPAITGNRFFFCTMVLREICGVWAEWVFG